MDASKAKKEASKKIIKKEMLQSVDHHGALCTLVDLLRSYTIPQGYVNSALKICCGCQ
jgi:hypothetical protein